MGDIIKKAEAAGELIIDEAGFYVYWPKGTGAYNSYVLRLLADELDRRNEKWEQELDDFFNGEKK